ncbi:MAG: thiol reductant ABC exporter subunit CydC [Actinomycetes bacterium]
MSDHDRAVPARSSLRRVVLLTRDQWPRLGWSALAGAIAVGSSVALLGTSGWLISRAAQHPPILLLTVAIVLVRLFGISRGVFRYVERLVSHDAALRALAGLRVRVYRRLEVLAPAGLPAFRSGDLLARLVGDVDALQDLYLRILAPVLVALLVGLGSAAAVGLLLPSAGVVLALALALAGVLAPALTVRLAGVAERRSADLRGELAAGTAELLGGMADLVAYDVADRVRNRLGELDAELSRTQARSALTAGVGDALVLAATGVAVLGALLVGIPAVRAGRLAGVDLAVVVLVPLAAFEAVAALPLAAQLVPRVRRSAQRVLAVVDAPDPVAQPVEPIPVPDPALPLVVRGLGVCWSPQGPLVLRDVDLELGEGIRVAVVGPSGSGKSTLVAALLRFVDPSTGDVLLGGVSTLRMDPDAVRRVVGLAAEDAHVFDSTIRANLRLAGPGSTEDQLQAALVRARLDEWVASLPDGLDTRVGAHGARLSGGQRQRLALARVFLADPAVLVLDEPGVGLDLLTADALVADALAATAGRTVLLITHRLAGLTGVDEILVLDHGRVVQRGTHAALLGADGYYRQTWQRERATDALARSDTATGR